MLMKVISIKGFRYVTSCTVTASRVLTFYLHNEIAVQTLMEALPFDEFQKRLLSLNPRVKFPENAVRDTLLEGEAAQITMASEPNEAGEWVLSLRYVMDETTAPLKWEWQLKPMATVTFYRQLLVDAIDVGHELHVIVKTLTKDLCAKDKEIEQYRREGFQLRRTTIRTKPFDLLEFNDENKDLLEEASAYSELNDVFPSDLPGSYSNSREISSGLSTPSTITSPSSSCNTSGRPTSSSSNATLSASTPERLNASTSASIARSRKRKAKAININRLEEKIKQRILHPEVQFNSQSSQEDDLADWLVDGVRDREAKPESATETKPVPDLDIKKETEASPQVPQSEAASVVKTELAAVVKIEKTTESEVAAPIAEEENNNETRTDSDQELDELRAILSASIAQKRELRDQ